MTTDELQAFDGAGIVVLFMLVDEPDEAWTRTLRLRWRDARPWVGDYADDGWFLGEEQSERVQIIDDDLRQTLGRHVGGAQLFLSVNVANVPEGEAITRTGLRIPREGRT